MRVPRWIVPVIALLFLFGSVGVGKAAGWWQTQGADLRTLDGATPADIRGSSTLAQVSDAFGIPMAELLPLLGLPEDTAPATPLKELEAYNEVSAVRDLVAVHLGLPPTGEVAPAGGEPAATTATATPAVPAAGVPAAAACRLPRLRLRSPATRPCSRSAMPAACRWSCSMSNCHCQPA